MEFPRARILVFSKVPVPGAVKTRLVPPLTIEEAVEVHRALLERTLRVARDSRLAPVELWVAGDVNHEEIREIVARHDVPARAQIGADLGERMAHAAATIFAESGLPIIIGSDCPEMSAGYLRAACGAVASDRDVVIGPAEDGGYVLVGLAKECLELFRGISWSTSRVLEETRSRIRSAGLASVELDTLWDLDRPADLERADLARLLKGL
jgi:rSAM/selenodomain-associated transferase 1